MKTPVGRRLLPRFIRLPPRKRKAVIFGIGVVFLVIIAAIVFAVISIVS